MTNSILMTDTNGNSVWVTRQQHDTIEMLIASQGGGCAAVHGYVPTTGYITCPVINIQMITRFSYVRLLERKLEALMSIQYSDIPANVIPADKLKGKTEEEWFNLRKAQELDSIAKTLNNERSDAHRQGHDRCYTQFAQGISAHLHTAKGADNKMHPVLTDGYPTVKSIMVSFLELNRTVVVEGQYKPVNSGASVLIGKAINKLLNARSVGIRKLSLKEDNFDSLSISKNVIVPENIQSLID